MYHLQKCFLIVYLLTITSISQTLTPAVLDKNLPINGTVTEKKQLHLPANVTPAKADILFAMDLTGSMGGALSSVQTNSISIMNQIRTLIPDARFGVVSHRDYPGSYSSCGYSDGYGSSGDFPYRRDQSITNNTTQVSNAINTLTCGGGNDGPESYTRVFYETYKDSSIGWRPGAKRIVLFWADNIPHDCNYNLDCSSASASTGKDPGRDAKVDTEDDLDLANVLSTMADSNITLIGFQYGGSSTNTVWQCYARKTGGESFESSTIPSDVATFIKNKISDNIKQIDTLKLNVCTTGYEDWLESVTPAFLTNIKLDTDKDFDFNLTFRVPSTATTGITHSFKVCAIGDGAEYASQQVNITVNSTFNNSPIADAGPDDTFYVDNDCSVLAALDGSGSSDPDGSISNWKWELPSGVSLSGFKPSVTLSPGFYSIRLIVTDDRGANDTDSVLITVRDTISPVPQLLNLDTLKGQCSVTLDTPTASDNCGTIIKGTTESPMTITGPGIYPISWTYKDSSGNKTTQLQIAVIKDTIPPAPDSGTLPDLVGLCDYTYSLPYPTASDNCSGTITATITDSLSYFTQGIHLIKWKYADANGNVSYQTQKIIIKDSIPPTPLQKDLPALKGSCSINFTGNYPKAIDNCGDTIIATTKDPLTYNEQGSWTIKWVYTDKNENSDSQFQQVTVDDTDPPVPLKAILDTLIDQCSITLVAPQAFDSCSGIITAITTSQLTISDSGVHRIQWTFIDSNSNSISQTQIVIIRDTTPPVITVPSDTAIILKSAQSSTHVTTEPATGRDNCSSVLVKAVRSDGLPLDSAYKKGTTVISWIGTDKSGNTDTAKQNVIIKINRIPDLVMPADTFMAEKQVLDFTFHASDSDGTVPSISVLSKPAWLTVTNDKDSTLSVRVSPGCTDYGNQEIIVIATDNIDTVQKVLKIRIDDVNFPPVFDSTGFEKRIQEGVPYILSIGVQDCDGTIPSIRMLTNVPGATFVDNLNNTGTFSWTPGANANGFYMCIFEATDNFNKPVRDTILFEVIDKNMYPPVLTVSTIDTTCSVNLPLVIVAKATDLDGTPPLLKATQLPGGANFTSDIDGNGVFSWTPNDTGTFAFFITAYDQVDSTIKDTKALTVTVNDENITGPKFEPQDTVTMYQNENLKLILRAIDPDGTNPVLRLISAPQGLHFVDNGNGTAVITWNPACNVSGIFILKSTASDGRFSDTINVPVVVKDVNCTPVLFSTGDINAQPGERISIPITSYDPDNNGSTPVLSVSCILPDYSFITKDDGSAIFSWTVCYSSGTYPVVFYATDGNSTDSAKVMISINKKGSLKISATPSNSRIYAFPSDCFQGKLLGKDSVVYTGAPGSCWFEFQAPGCRSQRIAYNIKADTTISISLNLKPVIPLMVISPDTLKFGSTNQILQNGSISFADLNNDHVIDLSVATTSGILCFHGIDSMNNTLFNSVPVTCYSGTLEPSIHHTFAYWNSNSNLSCILSTRTGKILKINLNTSTVDTLISTSNSRLYPTIFDTDKDGRKDMIVNDANKGLFIYSNTGTDSLPVIAFAKQCTDPSGSPLADLNGAPLLLDSDMDGKEEVLIFSKGILKLFKPDSAFSTLTYIENLSCGGKRITADSLYSAFIGSTTGISIFAMRTGNYILLYPTHLQGDITSDGRVDIRDVSKASLNWESTSDDQLWDPSINVKLSETGIEKIDIRDISRISKYWELQE